MIKTYKMYEAVDMTLKLVGIPSGEYIETHSKYYLILKKAGIIQYDKDINCFTFDDSNYYRLMHYIKDEDVKRSKIKSFLNKIGVDRYKINEDYTVDVLEDVKIRLLLNHLPIQFDYAMGHFDISNCGLLTLQGCPERVDGDFICTNNMLDDLKMGPEEVFGDYDVQRNTLKTLEGAPMRVRGNFACSYNDINNLIGGPKVVDGNYYADNCLLKSLEGSPEALMGDFDCSSNLLESLKGGPDMISGLYNCSNNDILSLKHGPIVVGVFKCNGNKRLRDIHLGPRCNKIISDNL